MHTNISLQQVVLTGFIAWVGIAVSHYRFRRAFDKQNYDKSKLKYTAKLFPFGPLFAGFLCIVVLLVKMLTLLKQEILILVAS